MLKFNVICLLVTFLAIFSQDVQAKINVFACEPEWKSLVDEIGGDNIDSFSATSAKQDPHYIRAKPSLIAKIRKSDLLICSGADLEVGWLPILLQKANSTVQPGKIGNLMVSDVVTLIEKPKILDRSMGDVHPDGNPHSHLNPYNILLVAKELNNRFQKIDSDNASNYQMRYEAFVKKWQNAIKIWEAKAEILKNVKIVVYHKSFNYLINWLQMEEVASLEVRPGIPPTVSHLENLLQDLRNNPPAFIIKSPYDPDDASNWLSEKAGIKTIILPYTIGGDKEAIDLFTLFERMINLMIQAT